jgi:acetylornithine deacetylase/succinyl-diaminopimelate desuccinylase-like protein
MKQTKNKGEGKMEASLVARVLDLAVAVQQVPAPPFGEAQRSAFLRDRFEVEGLEEISIDELGNVYGCLPGKDPAIRPVVVSAHLDTVFPFGVDLQVRREAEKIFGPGIGDNSLGLAGLFGLLWCLQQKPEAGKLPGDVWLVANVGEEGLGDLRGMRAVVDRFEDTPRAYIVLEGMALGQVYHRALGVQRYRITVQTNGGHSWVDYGKPSAIHELARLVNRICEIAVPVQPRSSMNVGIIAGGTSVNTIAAEAHLELDLRSEGSDALDGLVSQVEALVQAANRNGVEVSWDLIGQRPAGRLAMSHPLVRLAKRIVQELGLTPNLTIGSTDANIPLSRGLPAVCVGLSTGFGAHTNHEYINTGPVAQGLEQVERLVRGCFEEIQ